MKDLTPEEQIQEWNRCKESPYHFATKYMKVNGEPYTTNLTEEQFNSLFNDLQDGTAFKKFQRNRRMRNRLLSNLESMPVPEFLKQKRIR